MQFIDRILSELIAERDKIEQCIALLSPPPGTPKPAPVSAPIALVAPRRKFSAATRKKMAAAQKARYAARRAAAA
jgi:hypothetical protein